jgi:hypothetical protein
MPAPIPGTVVPSGSAVGPGGDTGLSGPVGPVGPAAVTGFLTKTASYTLSTADSSKYIICSGGSWTLALPAAVSGLTYYVRNDQGIAAGSTTGTITIQPPAGTIDGQASINLLPQQECLIITDGTNWRTFGLKREVILGTLDITASTANAIFLLPVGFRYFDIEIAGVTPVTANDQVASQHSVDGGSTWVATNYYGGIMYGSATAAANTDYPAATRMLFTGGQYNTTGPTFGANCMVRVYPGNSSKGPSYVFDSGTRSSGSATQVRYAGYWFNTAVGPANAIQFYCAGGNFSYASFTVKGVV